MLGMLPRERQLFRELEYDAVRLTKIVSDLPFEKDILQDVNKQKL